MLAIDPKHPISDSVRLTQQTANERQQMRWASSVGVDQPEDILTPLTPNDKANPPAPAPAPIATSEFISDANGSNKPPVSAPAAAPPTAATGGEESAEPPAANDVASRVVHHTKIQAYSLRMPHPIHNPRAEQTGSWLQLRVPIPKEWSALGFQHTGSAEDEARELLTL